MFRFKRKSNLEAFNPFYADVLTSLHRVEEPEIRLTIMERFERQILTLVFLVLVVAIVLHHYGVIS